MVDDMEQLVTVIYYNETSLELLHEVQTFTHTDEGRVIIPREFKAGKSIIAVCKGEVEVLNKVGDRILPNYDVA